MISVLWMFEHLNNQEIKPKHLRQVHLSRSCSIFVQLLKSSYKEVQDYEGTSIMCFSVI